METAVEIETPFDGSGGGPAIELEVLHTKTNGRTDFAVMKVTKYKRLLTFQKTAKDIVANDAIGHLQSYTTEERVFCFSAMTGAGKTIMLSKAIKKILKDVNGGVAVVWATIGDGGLADQSKDSLKEYLYGSGINVFSLKEALIACPNNMAGNVVVVAWNEINQWYEDGSPKNIAMKENEREINFPQMCANTRTHVPILLVIDESHTHADTEKSKHLRKEVISPLYTILSSATPTENKEPKYRVPDQDVIKSGLVKKNILCQEFDTYKNGVLAAAIKLIELIDLAKMIGSAYLPKMLIFVPNADKNCKNVEVDEILAFLKEKFGWTQDDGDIKLWFSGAKDTEACKQNMNATKVIITKEAIDTGIDIPSIQVIVQLRSTKNARVQIQKVGRGRRMPEQKHYGNALDTLFFFAFSGIRDQIDWAGAEDMKGDFDGCNIKIRDCYKDSINQLPIITGYRAERVDSLSDKDDFADEFYSIFKKKIEDHAHLISQVEDHEVVLRTWDLNLEEQLLEDLSQTTHLADKSDIGTIYSYAMRDMLKHLRGSLLSSIEKSITDGLKI